MVVQKAIHPELPRQPRLPPPHLRGRQVVVAQLAGLRDPVPVPVHPAGVLPHSVPVGEAPPPESVVGGVLVELREVDGEHPRVLAVLAPALEARRQDGQQGQQSPRTPEKDPARRHARQNRMLNAGEDAQ